VYFLVLLHEPPERPEVDVDHEAFVDSLIRSNLILLGGPLRSSPEPGIWAAYVLSCPTPDVAQAVVATDPLVTHGLAVPTVTTWELVAINPAAITVELAVTPDDPRLGDPPRPEDGHRPRVE
jgi:hypothetical protein